MRAFFQLVNIYKTFPKQIDKGVIHGTRWLSQARKTARQIESQRHKRVEISDRLLTGYQRVRYVFDYCIRILAKVSSMSRSRSRFRITNKNIVITKEIFKNFGV